MRNLFLFLSTILLTSSAFAKAASYICDDLKKDDGYSFTVVDLNNNVQNVVVHQKSKRTTVEIDNLYLKRVSQTGKWTTFAFNEPDHGLQMKISERDTNGKRTANFRMTTKRGTKSVNTLCRPE